jgi:nucleoside-diphosphate-sugar epimerase
VPRSGSVAAVPTAFVTGGSGFIGGTLIERLGKEGWEVRALARSESAAERVRERGAEPVSGDLEDHAALRKGAEGSDTVFHAAAALGDWGDPDEFERINVGGTANVIAACRAVGVRRLVHVGTEAALMAGEPLVNVNEDAPLRPDSPALYSATKAKAELRVRAANRDGLETVVIRPRFVWGRGDTTLLPALTSMVRSGRFRWIGGGNHLTATTHVDNTVEGLWLGATKAPAGGVWFVTDGEPVVFRDFVSRLLETQGVTPPEGSLPAAAAGVAAHASEGVWRLLRRADHPPVTRFATWIASQECTIDISRAERDLGYRPVKSREDGLAELAGAAPAA